MVYVVDDSQIIRSRIKSMLNDLEGVKVIKEAGDVEQAAKQLGEIVPDVIILDIQLPDGNGFDVLKMISKRNIDPLIIMLTNFPDQEFRDRAFELGADYFFDKSYEFEKVVDVLEDFFKKTGSSKTRQNRIRDIRKGSEDNTT